DIQKQHVQLEFLVIIELKKQLQLTLKSTGLADVTDIEIIFKSHAQKNSMRDNETKKPFRAIKTFGSAFLLRDINKKLILPSFLLLIQLRLTHPLFQPPEPLL